MQKLFSLLFAVVLAATTPLNIADFQDKADIYAKSSDSINATELTIKDGDEETAITEFPYQLKDLKEGKTYVLKSGSKTFNLHIDNTAPTITSTVESGTYNEVNATVTVKDADEITGSLSKDGSPSELEFKDGVASVKLTEKGSYTVKVTAKDKAGNEETKTFNYTIHKDAPVIKITGADNKIQNSDYNISIKVESDIDLKNTQATLNDKEVDISKNIVVSEEGSYTLKVEAEDIAGNKTTETKTFQIDKTVPELAISGVQDKDITNTDVSYTVSGSDNIKVTLNGQEAEKTGTITKEGKYVIEATASDEAGNTVKKSVSFEIDKTNPEIKISGVDGSFVNKTVNYTITADGDITATITGKKVTPSGIVDVNETKTGKNTITGTISENGGYTIIANAVDAAGNKAEQQTVVFTIDKTLPEITIVGLEDKKFYNSKSKPYKVTGTDTSDLTQNVETLTPEVTIDGKAAPAEGTAELNEGVHTLKAKVTDVAGNVAEKTISFEIDTTSPEVNFNNLSCVDDLRKIEANGTDKNLSSVVLEAHCDKKSDTINNNKFIVKDSNGPLSLKHDDEGESVNDIWTFTITATDLAGNIKSSSKTIRRDTVAPKINIDKVPRYVNKNVSINASSSDPNPKSTKLFINKDGKEYESDLKTTLSAEGHYELTVKAVDDAGNKSDKTIEFTIDKTPPKVDLSAPSGHNRSVSSVSAKSNEDGTIYMDVICDGKNVYSGKDEKNIAFSKLNKDGEYSVSSYAVDLAGNKSKTETQKFIIDSTAPVVNLSGIKEGAFANKAVTITAEVDERFYETNDVSFTYNGTRIPFKSTGKNSKVSRTFNKDGVYEIKLSAKDKAGNSSATKTLKFTLDTKKPEITISAPDQGTYDSIIAPKVTIKDEYFKTKDISLSKNVAFKDAFGKTGGTRSYVNIPKLKENDGIYTLNVKATDEAGNVSTATKTFTVNRFGSTFEVKKKPSEYAKAADSDVVIVEKNVSGIDSYQVKVSRDAESFEAENVKVKTDGTTTTYTIPKSNFDKDGIYKVTLTTKDKAGNTSKSKADFSFIVDNAKPVITYKGVEPNSTYQESTVKMYIEATDTLTEKPEIKVTSGLKNLKVLSDENGEFVEIGHGYNQDIKITATDKAGNSASTEIENVSVSTSKLAPVIAHKKIAGGVLAGLVAAGAGLLVFLKKRKKDSPDGDDIVM